MNLVKHSLWFAPLLIVSLALKFYGSTVPSENPADTLRVAAEGLRALGYSVVIKQVGDGRLDVRRDTCVAQLRLMDPHGTGNTFYRSKLVPADSVRYAWRGSYYKDRPSIRPLLEYYVKREFARRGIALNRIPVWMAGFGKGCGSPIPAYFSNTPIVMQPVTQKKVPRFNF